MHRAVYGGFLQLAVCCLCLHGAFSWLSNWPPRERASTRLSAKTTSETATVFREFVTTLQKKQGEIIDELEEMDGSGERFTNDTWGCFAGEATASGGITRVIQGGDVIEKGACSFTLIQQGVLSSERASAIRSRQGAIMSIKAGDTYSAAALSIVLHSRSPMVPTFRSDVRIFLVETNPEKKRRFRREKKSDKEASPQETSGVLSMAWFGGGGEYSYHCCSILMPVARMHHCCSILHHFSYLIYSLPSQS